MMDKTSEDRINKMIEGVMKVARGDYSVQIELSDKNDDFDSLAMGINMMIDAIRDEITEHKETEKELKDSQERLRIIFEYAPDGYYLGDLRGNFIDGNMAAEELTSYKKEELIGKNFLKLKLLSPKDIPKATSLLAKNALGKPTGPDEFTLFRKDGTRVAVEIRTYPVKIKGRTVILGNVRDITERKKVEEAIRQSAERLSSFMNSASDNFFLLDSDLNFVEINKKGLESMGKKKKEAIGKHITEIIPDVKESGRYDKHLEVLRTGKPFVIERYIPHSIFGDKHFILKSFKVGDGLGILGIDITERIKAEKQIKKSLEEKEILLKEIHHRVKNNMQVISSLLNIQAGYIKDEEIQEIFHALHDRIRSMSLLYEMLYKSKDLVRVDLSEYIRNLTTRLISMYRDKVGPIDLKLNVKDVYLNLKRAVPCGLIITELVSNSLKHAFSETERGEIAVEMYPDKGEKYTLIIRDSGKGFPEGLDFHETESLGMKLVVNFVNQLKGTIELNRKEGTKYKIVF